MISICYQIFPFISANHIYFILKIEGQADLLGVWEGQQRLPEVAALDGHALVLVLQRRDHELADAREVRVQHRHVDRRDRADGLHFIQTTIN